jgi:hypothetical protein
MKKKYALKKVILSALVAITLAGFSCKKKDDAPTNNNNTPSGQVVEVKDSISQNTTWTSNNKYLLKGYVYVTKGATLTIQPGTIIKGDKDSKGALIIERGAELMAVGTSSQPIIFTSNQPKGSRTYGDWGGVILCGYAPTNWTAAKGLDGNTLPSGQAQVEGGPRSLYGGSNASDNSGDLEYIRIEFAGVPFSPNNEVNGLTFCGVGSATKVDHIQVSYSGDDSYEWFGGSVNCKHLVSHRAWDDDFDTDNGFNGKVQFGVILRDPYAADQSGSHGFESDSYQDGTNNTQLTQPVFSNITAVGPLVNPSATQYDPQFVSAAQIRRGSSLSLMNSLLIGFPAGVVIDESNPKYGSTIANIKNSTLQIQNTAIAGVPDFSSTGGINQDLVYVVDGARSLTPVNKDADTSTWQTATNYAGPYSWSKTASFHNQLYATEANGLRLQSPFNLTQPNFLPTSTSPLVYPAGAPAFAPAFSSDRLQDAYFERVNYVGAFGSSGSTATDNWTIGWTNFDPQNTDY